MGFIRKLWWGQYPLALSFWGFYVFGFLVAAALAVLVTLPLWATQLRPVSYLVRDGLFAFYWIVATVGVWRSADSYPHTRLWPILAKIVVCVWSARLVWSLANGGVLGLLNQITASS
jgi:hypothetical protein